MSLKTGNHTKKKPITLKPTPYSAFGGIKGNVGTSQISNVPMATPADLGYMSGGMEAQIAAYNNPQLGMGEINPYMDMALDPNMLDKSLAPAIDPSGFNRDTLNSYLNRDNPSYTPNSDPGDYFTLLRGKESSHNYQAVNERGYLGGYQMREGSLIDAGLVKPGTSKKGLNNPDNWYGDLNKEKFLASPEIQDNAVRAFTEKNKKYLGDLYTNASPSEQRGLLGSAHLIGAGGTKKNMNSVDGNNISGRDYYNYFSTH